MQAPAPTSARAQTAAAKLSFPLPDGVFRHIQLTYDQVRDWESHACELIEHAMRECDQLERLGPSIYAPPWACVAQQDSLCSLRLRDPQMRSLLHHRVFGAIPGDYRELMEFMYGETSETCFEWKQLLFRTLVDAMVLGVFKCASREHPHRFMGITLCVVRPVPWRCMYFCFFEYMAYMKDAQGRHCGVRVEFTIPVREVDELMAAMHVRSFGKTILQILRPDQPASAKVSSAPPKTRIFMVSLIEAPIYVPFLFNKKLLEIAARMAASAESRRIAQTGVLPAALWVRKRARSHCQVCCRAFHLVMCRYHCHLCGEIVCRRCFTQRFTPARSARSTRICILQRVNVCLHCLHRLRDQPPSMFPGDVPRRRVRHDATVKQRPPYSQAMTQSETEAGSSVAPSQRSWTSRNGGHDLEPEAETQIELELELGVISSLEDWSPSSMSSCRGGRDVDGDADASAIAAREMHSWLYVDTASGALVESSLDHEQLFDWPDIDLVIDATDVALQQPESLIAATSKTAVQATLSSSRRMTQTFAEDAQSAA